MEQQSIRKLKIGPTTEDPVHLAHIEQAWHRFARRFPLPINFGEKQFCCITSEGTIDGIAAAFLDEANSSDNCTIAVDWVRFTARSDSDQELTLLHECIHLMFMTGSLRQHTLDGYAWLRGWRLSSSPLVSLAYGAWSRVQEVMAELYLQAHYPSTGRERVAYLIGLANGSVLTDTGPFRSVRALIQLLQLDLLVRLAAGSSSEHLARAQELAHACELNLSQESLIPSADVEAFRNELSQITFEPMQYKVDCCQRVTNHILGLIPI